MELNTFLSDVELRNEFNKAVAHFGFKASGGFSHCIVFCMKEVCRQYHEDIGVDIKTLQKPLRIMLYERETGPRIRAPDLHTASGR